MLQDKSSSLCEVCNWNSVRDLDFSSARKVSLADVICSKYLVDVIKNVTETTKNILIQDTHMETVELQVFFSQ